MTILASQPNFAFNCCPQKLSSHTLPVSSAAASLARKIYIKQGLGVGALRRQYGGRNKRKGAVPEHFARASGGLIRHILQQLETIGFVEKHTGSHGGRRITSQVQHLQMIHDLPAAAPFLWDLATSAAAAGC